MFARTKITTLPTPSTTATIVNEFMDSDGLIKTQDSTGLRRGMFATNFSVASQAPGAASRTYLTGSSIAIPVGKAQIGTGFRWMFDMTKTAAGLAASTFDICVGTAGTTADTARVSFVKPAGTAVIDCARVLIEATVRGPLSASCIMVGHFNLSHNLAATGHAIIPVVDVTTISGTFDITTANLIVGVCLTSGAADAITIQLMQARAWNL